MASGHFTIKPLMRDSLHACHWLLKIVYKLQIKMLWTKLFDVLLSYNPIHTMSTLQDVDSFLSAFNAENISQLGSRSESSSNALVTSADPTDPTFVSSTQSFVHPGDLTLLDTRSDDFHEKICAVCENGGSLICCSGRCLRSFHPSCLGLHVSHHPPPSCFH